MLKLLKELCHPFAVSGDENTAMETAEKLLSPLGKTYINTLGSVICELSPKNDSLPTIMLTAHLDRIGLMVTRICEDGFLKAASVGGIDRRTLPASRVTVHTESGAFKGVICSVPPHLSDGSDKSLKVEDCAIDVGLTSEVAKKVIGYGDRITFDGDVQEMIGDRVCSSALDNRAGCAAIITAAKLLKDTKNANIVVALTSQEETGGAGAKTSAYAINPDYAFVVDVSMAHTSDDKAEDCKAMGEGPMIGFSPILNRELSKKLCETAKANDVPFQYEVMGGRTGTDSDNIAVSRNGVKVALISIPLRFMHTPCEVLSLADVENTAKLIALQVGGILC